MSMKSIKSNQMKGTGKGGEIKDENWNFPLVFIFERLETYHLIVIKVIPARKGRVIN